MDFLYSCIDYFIWVFYSVIFIKFLIGAIEEKKPFSNIVIFIGVTMVVLLFLALFQTWYNLRYKPITDRIIAVDFNKKLLDQAAKVELACYEDTEFYNTYTIAIKEADTRVTAVLNNMANVLFSFIATTSVFIFMFMIDHYVILFTIFPLIGNFILGRIMNKIYYNRTMEATPDYRRLDYVNRIIYLQNYAKEIRLTKAFHVLKSTYEHGFNGIVKIFHKYGVKSVVLSSLKDMCSFLLVFEGVFFYGAYRAIISKTLSLSGFSILASAIVSCSWMMIGLSQHMIGIFENGLYIDKLRSFMDYESKIPENIEGDTPATDRTLLELDHVSFTYHGQEEPMLKDISLKIKDNEKIAFVGQNGAGKTTLIKLLMRLYDPVSGEIRFNGKNIKEYQLKKYRDLFGTAFQDFQVFSMSVAENVLMHEVEGEEDILRVKEALKKTGAIERVMALDKGINTTLTREFDDDGAVLSGGETQKIAIARAFLKKFNIAVFDEPSSALDPIAEYELYESMMEECKDKAVIFISHRLSSVIHADHIYMLEQGCIIEEGTHKELMNLDGKYATMFRMQAEKYVEGAGEVMTA